MAIDPEQLRQAMRQWTTGVTIVSVRLDSIRHGMTVNSFTSVSLTPPLVLVSLERGARTHGLIKQSGYFGVTILGKDQREISDRFAGRQTEYMDRFANLGTYTMVSGAPLLKDGLAGFDCHVVSTYEAGTHTVFIGDVLAVQIGNNSHPLVYYDRDYRGLQL
jgi:flavin reductase (DIM6/NTAB) family NADH-FMN oxidoreductase RutF